MPTKERKTGRRNRYGQGVRINKTITIGERAAAGMSYTRFKYGINWSAECERMILEYIDQLERKD